MNRFFKRITTFILVLSIVVGALPAVVFAAGVMQILDTEATEFMDSVYGTQSGNFPQRVPRTADLANNNLYLLSVSLGAKGGEISNIIISYYTSENSSVPYKQILQVNRKESDATTLNSIKKGQAAFLDLNENWPFYGSKFATYTSLVGDSAGSGNFVIPEYTADGTAVDTPRSFGKYAAAAKSVVADVNETKYPSAYQKAGVGEGSSTAFQANGTDCIAFRLQYKLASIESITFLCEMKDGGGYNSDIIFSGWSLIQVDDLSQLQATNFSYLSNRLGLIYDGKVICQSTQKTNERLKDGIRVTDNRAITFFNKSKLSVEGFDYVNESYPGSDDTYRCDISGSSDCYTLCCTDKQDEIIQTDNPTLKKLDFVITFADMYGAGIEEFNVSPVAGVRNSNYTADYTYLLSANGSDLVAGYINEGERLAGGGAANMPAGFVKLDGETALWNYVRWDICNKLYEHTKDTILGKYWPDGDTFSKQTTMQVISFAHGMRRAMEEYGIEITSDIPPEPIFANTSGLTVTCEDLLNTHPLNLSDVLDAQIEYTDIYGVVQSVSLPVISNSLLNAALDGYETGIENFANSSFVDALKTGEYLEYAQQGQSISFSVEFPALQELKSISLSYFDPRVSDDAQIAISNIAVYDAEDLAMSVLVSQNKEYEKKYNDAEAYYQACVAEMARLKAVAANAEETYNEFLQSNEYMSWSGRYRMGGLQPPGGKKADPIGDKFVALRAAYVNTAKDVERYQPTLDAAKAARDRAKETYYNTKYISRPVLSDEYYEKNLGNGVISALPTDATLVYISDQSREEWIGNASSNYNFKLINLSDVPVEARDIPDFSDYTDTYLATIKTSAIKPASSRGDVKVSFGYKRLDDHGELVDAEVGPISIKEGIQNFDGYNIGVVLKDGLLSEKTQHYTDFFAGAEDAAYYYGMYQGNELTVMFNAKGVEQFTGISFEMENSLDDWQVEDVTILKVENMSARQIHPFNSAQRFDSLSDDGDFAFAVNRYYDRTVYGKTVAEAHDMSLLLQGLSGGASASYSFTSKTASSTGDKRINDSEWEDEMPYEVAANMVHGYATEVQAYEVRVKVGSNSEYVSGDDTCGSDNMYYFQLQFRDSNGKMTDSGYVLANRQLSSDGFRSGVTESFTISTNKDYGDVVGVNIIPDDISSNSNPTDKLCIDEISVIKKNINAPDKKYVFNNIGWISTEYRDTSEKTQKETRSEAELAQRFKTEYSAYMVNLEVALTWGRYDGDEGARFVGDMTADIQYETSNGSQKHVEVQVVKGMYEYRNKTAPINTATGRYQSDKNTMFVEETTDRFLVALEDCNKINKIVFHAFPNESISIPFKAVEISVLKSEGTLAYASDGTYIRRYDADYKPVLVAELESVPTKLYSAIYGQQNLIPFYLSQKEELGKFDEKTTFASIPERVPAYGEDTINMLFYLAEGTPFPSEGHYLFTGGVRYARSNSPSNYYTVQASSSGGSNNFKETRIDGRKVLALYGAPTQGISTIKDAYAYCDNIVKDYYLGHVVVQQVRDNTIIDTKIINFADGGLGSSGRFSQEKGASSASFGRFDDSLANQEFTLMLGEGTPEMTLVEGSTDIAVQFKYKSKTVDRAAYNSPIVFATDASDIKNSEGHNTLDIHAGSVLKFRFNEFDVQDVDQVIIRTVSDKGSTAFKINIGNTDGFAGATLVCTEAVQDTDGPAQEMRTGYYTFELSGNISVGAAGMILKPAYTSETDSNAFRRVDITFGTQSASDSLDSAGKYPIKASIKYMKNKLPVVAMISDIRNYISDVDGGSFDVDGKATTTFMFPGYADIVSITIEPEDPDGGTASWNLGTITVQADGIDKEARTMKVNKHIVQGKPETVLLNGQEQSKDESQSSGETDQ